MGSRLGDAEEDHPSPEVIAEVFEMVRDPCSDKQGIARPEGNSLCLTDECASSGRNDIKFVSGVWGLWIYAAGRVVAQFQCAALEHECRATSFLEGGCSGFG